MSTFVGRSSDDTHAKNVDGKVLADPKNTKERFRGTIISSWSESKLMQFERDLLARKATVPQIAKKYNVSPSTVQNYRSKYLADARNARIQVDAEDTVTRSRKFFGTMLDEIQDSIDEVKGRKVDEKGEKIKGDLKVHGNVVALLGLGVEALKVGLGPVQPDGSPGLGGGGGQVVNIISIPKAPGTPIRGKPIGNVDYKTLQIHDVNAEQD